MVYFCFTDSNLVLNIGAHIYGLVILLFLFLINTDLTVITSAITQPFAGVVAAPVAKPVAEVEEKKNS